MKSLKLLKQKFSHGIKVTEQSTDRWLMNNPYALYYRFKFVNSQRIHYHPIFSKLWWLTKLTILGYLISNIFGVEFNMPIKRKPKYLTEYYTLANQIEYDRFQQLGAEPHLNKLYERGLRRGLAQIELLELIKLHGLNEPARPLAQHLEYLRILKS